MSFGFSVGDFIAVGTLLATTVRKCQAASKEFQELSHILQTTSACAESARSTLESIFDQLPTIHQNAVACALIGLRNLIMDLNSELDRYAAVTPGEFQLIKLQFALLADSRATESKLTLYLTMLNTCMAMIICDSMTRSNLQPYNITNLVGGLDHQAAPQMIPYGKPELKQSVGEQWIASASSSNTLGSLLSRSFAARGIYTYNATIIMSESEYPRTDRVGYKLRVSGNRLHGTSKDSIGSATVEGQIDLRRDTVRFIKQYIVAEECWEYEGHFTSCGIVGEWHYPGDPPGVKHYRGRFAIWLQSDEAVQGGDLEKQMEMLENKGALLTRSLSFKSY